MPEEKAKCRGCGRVLDGSPYGTGKPTWNKKHPRYGLILEGSMPGAGSSKNRWLSGNLDNEISRKWGALRREYPGARLD